MRSINNQYFIEYEINTEENFSNYVITNNQDKKRYALCILKNDFTYEKTREYILSKFKTIRNLNFENVVNLINIIIIYNIDGIKLDKPQYGYLMEYLETRIETSKYLDKCSACEKLDIFMELCSAINTLNIKGYIFDDIKIKDIKLVYTSQGKIKVKIKNLLKNEIRKFSLLNVTVNSLPYPYNIDNIEENNYLKDNIIEVISLFDKVFNNKELKNELKELKDIKKIYNQANTINKNFEIKSFIEYVNDKMGRSYKIFVKNALNTIETDLDIIDLDEEIKIIEKTYNRILQNKEKYKIVAFNGESGSGKTRLLNELKYRLENKYFKNITYIGDLDDNSITKEQLYNMYIGDICTIADKSLLDKYEIYIKKFISILVENQCESNETNNNQILQLFNRVGKFICEYTVSNPLVLIIDDLDKKNKIFRLFIRYISFLGNNLENILMLFSMNESICDQEFLKYVTELKSLNEYEEYKLNYFNQYNTSRMVKNILNTNERISSLCTRIYSETLGNPQYIQAIIQELYENKVLYFNEKKGKWDTNTDVKDILIPKILEETLEINLSLLDKEEINVLKTLSVYETPLSEKIILTKIIKSSKETQVYRILKLKGYLIDKISDHGMLVGFTNNLLRNIIYLKLDEKQKNIMHANACEILEDTLEESDYYIEEFLVHLEKCKKVEKLLIYTTKYAEMQEKIGNMQKAILYYKKSLKYASDEDATKIAIDIAKIYEKISNHEKSYRYFKIAKDSVNKSNDLKTKVYVMLEMAIIKINSTTEMNSNIEKILDDIRKILKNLDYPRGDAHYHYAIALKFSLEYNHNMTLLNAKRALEICEKNHINDDVYGWITITLATAYIKIEDYIKSENLCLKAIDIFEKNNNNNGSLFSKVIHALICKEQGESTDIILNKFIEINKLSNKYKAYKREISSLQYIAKIYIEEGKYHEGEKCLLKALSREREEGIDSYSVNICNELCMLYIRGGKVKLAIKYYYLIKQMQKNIKLAEEEIININVTCALYNILICNFKLAYEYLDKIYKLIKNSKSFNSKSIACSYYELKLYSCNSEEEIKNVYHKLDEKIKGLNRPNVEFTVRIRAIKTILKLGYSEFAKDIFDSSTRGYSMDYNTEGIYTFLEFNFRYKNSYNFLINKALRICTFITNQEIKADLYYIMGEKYSQLKCYLLSMNYYYESLMLHENIINSLPDEDKLVYANNSEFLNTRTELIGCLNNILNLDLGVKKIKKVENNLEINEIIKELDLKNILKNQHIYDLIQNLYEKCYYNDLSSIYKVFESFSSDIVDNLENVIKYMARITLSDKAMIVTENNKGENSVICTYRVSDKNEMNRYFSLKVDSQEEVLVIANNDNRFDQLDDKVLKDGIKACVCMKLRNINTHVNSTVSVNARLILIANNAINYINSDSKEIIEKFKPFLIFLLEKYNLTITSTLDKLTGVYNRKYFEEALISLIYNAKIEKSEFAIIMFDIDDFKGVNDKYGHQTGDEVLVKLTKEVKKCISKNDIIGRYGGEEFIVLLPQVDKEKAINMAEKIRNNVEDARILGDKRKVTISIGITISAYEGLNSAELIKRADQALYRAKHEGKNRCTLWRKDFEISKNINNELTGVFSGNVTKDYNLFTILKDVLESVKHKDNKEEKMYNLAFKIMQVIECDETTLFIVKDEKVTNIFSKERTKEGWSRIEKFNYKLISKTIEEKKGIYLVDWDNIDKHNRYGIPDWKSVCIAPIICNGEVLALIYLSVSVNKKEFTYNDLNLLNCFADVGVPIFY